ncbi:endo-1,4-beta-xylanase 1 [Dendrobium catenatum]|uniref:endo-1,4-beta-xylanase 1 n=1 Tax=Dendrobium catenatum TaxID=906689 RepID=UPI00109FCC1E|nr:endo-1,4-beta-xylanase 1 [Dendrobium catenatum]
MAFSELLKSRNFALLLPKEIIKTQVAEEDQNIILNPEFEDGLNNWSARGCKILLQDSIEDGKVLPLSGKFFASATERTQNWNGIQQEITGRVTRKLAYEVTAIVRLFGSSSPFDVRATVWVQTQIGREQYIGIATVQATDTDWVQLKGKFLINSVISKAVIYLEGPPPGTDVLVNSFVVKHAEKLPPSPPPDTEDVLYGVNIITNSGLNDDINGWFPLGSCTLTIANGSPLLLPPMAKESLGNSEPLNGNYILVTNRSQTWMGPAQEITDNLKLQVTYQVSAWVRIGSDKSGPQNINVALGVDSQWVNGGQVEVVDDRWYEIGGSFRIEKLPTRVIVYVQGPSPGVDFMVAGLHVFPVDRIARFKYLKKHTNKVRKRDVILKISGSNAKDLLGTTVNVRQIKNTFPIGSCISRMNIDNEDYVNFFVNNFNWGVFGNELKWYWTESQQGILNYTDADELLDFCNTNGIDVRGHCIFWEVESAVQPWVKALSTNDLVTAVQSRITSLMLRYKGKFKHYDVNNEMLHGSFYQDRLGKDIRANMFKTASQLDASPKLFVNDYHIEDATDTRASPEKYIQQILDLQEQGAAVTGIGVQGHIDKPVGPIVSQALDKLGVLGLPIWFTELDVSAENEYVRADDLEVMLREAYAHPSVEGIMLWGFWELFMSRENAHLVNAEGDLNEAGKRLLSLKEEWLSHAYGKTDDLGEFKFRGFHGTYSVDVITSGKKISQTFSIDKGDVPLVVNINMQS